MSGAGAPLLQVEDLAVAFQVGAEVREVLHGVSFEIARGETVALVGESGSGKSVTALSVPLLLPYPAASHPRGPIRLAGREMVGAGPDVLTRVRGGSVSMVFQEPMTSLNPVHTVEKQLREMLALHKGMTGEPAKRRIVELLELVGIQDPQNRLGSFPHQLSGGQRQRVMIAMALANEPDLLIADEPTTALDVTIQAQILDLMREMHSSLGAAVILITHDMGVVAENADRVVVMYAGRKVEEAPVDDLFENPGHPYTVGLLGSIPHLDDAAHADSRRARLNEIKGMVPSLARLPQGCAFAPRCSFATSDCHAAYPPLAEHRPGHWIACWHADKLLGAGA